MQISRLKVAINIWTARLIPCLLAVGVGYATYVFVVLLSVDYLIAKNNAQWTSCLIVVTYFILFIFMISSFLRLIFTTYFDPPYIPLGADCLRDKNDNTNAMAHFHVKDNVDPPGLEQFYTKDIFLSDSTGKPRWCFPCGNWKPDRAHHCHSSNRCIRKMDHFCPWIGGPVGENNFKFFIQFTSYSAFYCTHLIFVLMYYAFGLQKSEDHYCENQFWIVILIAGFFLIFTTGMALNSIMLALRNLTQVENLDRRRRIYHLAVFVPPWHEFLNPNLSPKSSNAQFLVKFPLRGNRENLESHRNTLKPLSATHSRLYKDRSIARMEINPGGDIDNRYKKNSTDGSADAELEKNFWSETKTEELFSHRQTVNTPSISHSEIQKGLKTSPQIDNTDLSHHGSRVELAKTASRTFVIVQTNQGENPWDIGTHLQNWKSVMGESILEWILPFRRSPCCNHESPESQFQLGPVANLIRSRHGLLTP